LFFERPDRISIRSCLPRIQRSRPIRPPAPPDPLVELLTPKGVLTAGKARNINAAPSGQYRGRLLPLLRDKGLISADLPAALKFLEEQPHGMRADLHLRRRPIR